MTESVTDTPELHAPVVRAVTGRGTALFHDEPHTLAELFYKAFAKYDRPDALNYKADGKWRSISSTEMIARAEHIALGLHSLGLRKSDRAAILAANSPEWTLADAGCQFAGVIDVPIYTTLTPASVRYILNDSGARLFFIQNLEVYQRLQDAIGECRSLEKLVIFDADGVNDKTAISLDGLEHSEAICETKIPA